MLWSLTDQTANNPKMLPALEVSEAGEFWWFLHSLSPADVFQVLCRYGHCSICWKKGENTGMSCPVVILASFFSFPKPELKSWNVPILSFALFSLSKMWKCHVRGTPFCQKVEHSTYCLLGSGHDFCPKGNNLCLFRSLCVPGSQAFGVRFVGNAQELSVWVSLTNVPDSDISSAMLILPYLRASLIPSKAQGIPWCNAQRFCPCCCTWICAAQLSAADSQPKAEPSFHKNSSSTGAQVWNVPTTPGFCLNLKAKLLSWHKYHTNLEVLWISKKNPDCSAEWKGEIMHVEGKSFTFGNWIEFSKEFIWLTLSGSTSL